MLKADESAGATNRMGARRARGLRVSSSLAEINVVPLVDVMLVLLVIFMVAAPMMTQGFGVKLPTTKKAPTANVEPISVTIPTSVSQDGRVKINNDWVKLEFLTVRMQETLDGRLSKDVTIAADASVLMDYFAKVIASLKEAGVQNVNFLTQPGGGGAP